MSVPRIGVLTNGGDCPGLNAAIRAVVKTASDELGAETIGIWDGYEGLLDPVRCSVLGGNEVRGLLPRGGTFLGTGRCDPFQWRDPSAGVPRDSSAESSRTAQ